MPRSLSIADSSCSSCGAASSKYRCPGCGAASCCLECVKRHKAQTACTGKRDAAAYLTLHEFDDASLHRDYHFLEAAQAAAIGRCYRGGRCLDVCSRLGPASAVLS